MPYNAILSDGIVSFGKYREKRLSGEQIFKKDPAYILWCVSAGVASVDDALEEKLWKWVDQNEKEANRVIASGRDAARKSGRETVTVSSEGNGDEYDSPTIPPKKVPSAPSMTNPAWGSW